MTLLTSTYRRKLPWQINVALISLAVLTVVVLYYFIRGVLGTSVLPSNSALGSQGDFIGGHLAAIVGSITLIVVILTGYLQIYEDRRFRIREFFLTGISTISSYEAQEPGTEQAMRLLDYLSLVALELDNTELMLILNTVITRAIRARLEEIEDAGRREYPNALDAKREIARILEQYYKPSPQVQ